MATASTRSAWAGRLALLGVSLVVACLAAEIAVRATLADEWDTGRLERAQGGFHLGGLVRFSADPQLYFELIPDLHLPLGHGWVRTDGFGRRIADPDRLRPFDVPEPTGVPADTPGGPVRLAVVGDSTCFGWGLPFACSYPELVRRRLEQAWQRPVELTNWCVPGYGSEQELRLFERSILDDPPDLLLWHYDHNDAFPSLNASDEVGLPPQAGDNLLGSAALKVVVRRLRRARIEASRVPVDDASNCDGYLTAGPAYDRHLAELERLASLVREHSLAVLVVVFDANLAASPTRGEHFERLHAGLNERLRAAGLPVLDLYDDFQALMAERGWGDLRPFWLSSEKPDAHPNRQGHEFLAETIAAEILSQPGAEHGPPPAGR